MPHGRDDQGPEPDLFASLYGDEPVVPVFDETSHADTAFDAPGVPADGFDTSFDAYGRPVSYDADNSDAYDYPETGQPGDYDGYDFGEEPPQKPRNKRLLWIASGGAAAAVLLLVFVFLLLRPAKPNPTPDPNDPDAPQPPSVDGLLSPPPASDWVDLSPSVPQTSTAPSTTPTVPSPPPSDGDISVKSPAVSMPPPTVVPASSSNDLLLCALSLYSGYQEGDVLTPLMLTQFAHMAISRIEPEKRFGKSDQGLVIPKADMDALLKECLGLSAQPFTAFQPTAELYEKDGYFIWVRGSEPEWLFDFFRRENQSGGHQAISYNLFLPRRGGKEFAGQYSAIVQPGTGSFFSSRLITLMEIADYPMPGGVSASSYLDSREGFSYRPESLLDDRPFTAWSSNGGDGGVGASLTLTFDNFVSLTGLSFLNGDLKDSTAYAASGRAKSIYVEMAGGVRKSFTLNDTGFTTPEPWQAVSFGEAVSTDFVTITIQSTYPGNTFDEVCLSEIYVF